MKKVLIVIDSLSSGGAEKSLISLLTSLDYEKYDVDLLMFSTTGLYLSLVPNEVKIQSVPQFIKIQQKSLYSVIRNRNYKELLFRVANSISLRNPIQNKRFHQSQITWKWMNLAIDKLNTDYDIAIAYSQGIPTYFVAEKVNAPKKLCWLNTDYKKANYNRDYDIKFYEKFNHIIAVSEINKEIFEDTIPEMRGKMCVVYDIISEKLVRELSKQKGGFSDNYKGLKILTIGRLVDAKGYDMAIEACYRLKKEGLEFKWYVIGEGDLEKYKKLVKKYKLENYFIFLGVYSNPYTFLSQCDIYVQPSRFEGFGLAIAEARILGKPIVATNFSVIHNQLTNEKNGIIVNMDAESIYGGINKLVNNSRLVANLRTNLLNDKVGTEKELKKVYSLLEN